MLLKNIRDFMNGEIIYLGIVIMDIIKIFLMQQEQKSGIVDTNVPVTCVKRTT